eukprot:17495_1
MTTREQHECCHIIGIVYSVIITIFAFSACSIKGGDVEACWEEEWWKSILIAIATIFELLLFASSYKAGPCGVDGRTKEGRCRRECSEYMTYVVAVVDTGLLIWIVL